LQWLCKAKLKKSPFAFFNLFITNPLEEPASKEGATAEKSKFRNAFGRLNILLRHSKTKRLKERIILTDWRCSFCS